jgi:hypothetical protein
MWLRLVLPLLLSVVSAQANETDDRKAIANAIAALNQPQQLTPITKPLLDQLLKGRKVTLGTGSGSPTVTISHEPWGEATLDFPQVPQIVNPRIDGGEAQFLTPFRVQVYGTFTYLEDGKPPEVVPLLFVLRRDSAIWRIVEARTLAAH